ncbi:MAG: sigma-54-dependent Fis family transcriptional regulator [Pyrinomonadaceae bacterium]|nr:sigma-54-dependent Fis family transcriptional regulator [Pyrinomonadaceae bacterium]
MSEQKTARILIAEDEANLRLVLQKELERLGYRVQVAPDGEAALRKLEESNVDVMLCDINMPRIDGMEVLRRVHERPNPPEVIMLTGQATVETAVEAMKLGAYDYLTKPYRITELDVRVKQAAEKRRLRVDNLRLREQLARQSGLPEIVSVSDAMTEAVRLVERVAPSEASVLITGESGTGKELIAHAIHRLSNRADGSFIDINCAAFQESLLESELFGYEAGAFSGAKGRKLGLIELADGGTLFLDEVTELPAQLQAKLLRAIETRTFFRVGGVRKVEVNVRIVAATNRNLESVVANESFRSDLLYRINGFQIDLAPLRDRPEDIEPLARYILNREGGTAVPEIEPPALDALRAYSWPGNVRQLKNCLERAVILSNNGRITINELPPEVLRPPAASAAAPLAGVSASPADASPPAGTAGGVGAVGLSVPTGSLRDAERQQILSALEQTGWHRGKTAEMLGISPSTLYRRLRDYNLEHRPR